MRLFGWFRRRPVDDYVGRHRPGSWAQVALPPSETAYEPSRTLITTPRPVPVEVPPIQPRQRVRLGFVDGSSVNLEDGSGESEKFRQVAARLIDDPR